MSSISKYSFYLYLCVYSYRWPKRPEVGIRALGAAFACGFELLCEC